MATVVAEPPAYVPTTSSQDLLDLHPSSSTPPPAYTERTTRKLVITSTPGAGILHASILDAAGRALYTTSSDAKLKKTSVRRAGPYHFDSGEETDVTLEQSRTDEELARFKWDRSSPRVRFCAGEDKKKKKRKIKCKEWLPLANSGTMSDLQSRVLTHDGARYSITERKGGIGCLLCIDDEGTSPLLPLARWRTAQDAKSQCLEILDDACAIPGLFDAFVLALVVLQSGLPLGDVPDGLYMSSPKFFGTANLTWQ